MRSDGFIKLSEVIKVKYIKRFKPTMGDFEELVETNEKKRFEMKEVDGEWMIRAV